MKKMRKRTVLGGTAVLAAAGLAAFFFNPTHALRMALADLRGADPGWLLAPASRSSARRLPRRSHGIAASARPVHASAACR